ncbi:receptor-like protein 53 isoform X2 [Prosopis cineraria]|uniref:receptor-like protein 53 isoform X2 n=1 Tax=Prosopis cineraria TaxID=364024 RepID=UPI002410706D|nr:receptor-like protein 53 isoform X2 [Prosopis cineraria]
MPKTIPKMLNSKLGLYLFCLIEIFCIFSCAGNSNMKSCAETDKQALLKLKDDFVDEGGILSSWEREVDCCEWKGISCNNLTGHVTHLNLTSSDRSTKLKGTINASLCELQRLTLLDLSFNDFEGQMIPKCIGSLGDLTELKLRKAKLTGIIPCELQSLSNLQTLDLGGLKYLDLSNNKIHGTVPEITTRQGLLFVDMSNNSLSGRLPNHWEYFEDLEFLNLAFNKLWGEIPNSIGTLNHIKSIHLNDNNFSGEMPSFMNSTLLLFIDLGQNNLCGMSPESLGNNLPNLIVLVLRANKLQGNIPTTICNLMHLQILDLSQNEILGIIPPCLDSLFSMTSVVSPGQLISYSNEDRERETIDYVFKDRAILVWKGSVIMPSMLLSSLATIDLSNNHLQGEILDSITRLFRIVFFKSFKQ